MTFKPQDHYFKKAKKENFAARSVYKLQEIDQKLKIFRPNQSILDLGAAPGSWSQYATQKILPNGSCLSLDLTPILLTIRNAIFIEADVFQSDIKKLAQVHQIPFPFDVILSDMAPKTTGIQITDQARSLELCMRALEITSKSLKPKGHFVCKLFHSEGFKPLEQELKKLFRSVHAIRPKSTRKESTEIFLIGYNFQLSLE